MICIDEKSLQLIGHSREPLAMASYRPTKQDYEYERNGTTNLFVAVEPKGGKRIVSVTAPLDPVLAKQFHRVLRAVGTVATTHVLGSAIEVAPPAYALGVRGRGWEFPDHAQAVLPRMSR